MISDPLRCELHFEVFSPVLTVHPFFKSYMDVNPAGIRKICHDAVAQLSFMHGDVIFAEHEIPVVPVMFFINSGTLMYIQESGYQIGVTKENWVAEAVLWTQWAHRGTLRANKECQILALNSRQFQSSASSFPGSNVRTYAYEFVKKLSSTRVEDLTDIGCAGQELNALIELAYPELADTVIHTEGDRRSPSMASARNSCTFLAKTLGKKNEKQDKPHASPSGVVPDSGSGTSSSSSTLLGHLCGTREQRVHPICGKAGDATVDNKAL